MTGGPLPIFPLEVVLFPHTPLPLHIFEARYKEMIGECIGQKREFGVVLAQSEGVLHVGCTATVEQVLQRHEDGRLDILTIGRRRFRLTALVRGRSFLQGEVEFFDDTGFGAVSRRLLLTAAARHREYAELTAASEETPDLDHPELSFLLAQVSPDLAFRQRLLETRSEAERMEMVAAHLDVLIAREKAKRAMKKVAGTNGHGRHIVEPDDQQ